MARWTQADYDAYENRRLAKGAEPKRPVRHEPVATTPREDTHPGRIRVRITCLRRRLIDPDNLCPKYFIDCLRFAGIIPNDRAQDIILEVEQFKVSTPKDRECTEITITPSP
jgi:hypothetical protein